MITSRVKYIPNRLSDTKFKRVISIETQWSIKGCIMNSEHMFQEELLRNEHILWTGQPKPKIFTLSDIVVIPLSLLWGGIAFVFGAVAISSGSLLLMVFGGFLAAVGLFSIIGRMLYRRWKKKNTYYAVTEKRVLALVNLRNRNVQAGYVDSIPVINKSIHSDGSGTLKFGNTSFWASFDESSGMDLFGPSYARDVPVFRDIKDAARVYELIVDLRKKSQRDSE